MSPGQASTARNSGAPIMSPRLRLGGWQREEKGRAFTNLSAGPNAAAMTLDNATDDGQSDTGAFEFLLAMHALKHAKQILRVAHVETGAVVPNEICSLSIDLLVAHLNNCFFFVAGEF